MREPINVGAVLVKEGTLFPEILTFESESYSSGWRLVKGLDGYALDRKVHESGWTFFYLAGESRATAIGREGQDTVGRVVKRILVSLGSEKFNSIEITRIDFKAFLGVPYASVSFHLRNMQKSMFLFGRDDPRVWEDALPVAA